MAAARDTRIIVLDDSSPASPSVAYGVDAPRAIAAAAGSPMAAIGDWAGRSPARPPWPGSGAAGPATRSSRSARASWRAGAVRLGEAGPGRHDGHVRGRQGRADGVGQGEGVRHGGWGRYAWG